MSIPIASSKGCFLALSIFFIIFSAHSQTTSPEEAQEIKEIEQEVIDDNGICFNCHGGKKYTYFNTWDERDVNALMNPYYVIDSLVYYDANHKTFRCSDCHSPDYETFPHDGELRMEWISTCMDCHEGDDDYKKYHFETIQEEFAKSAHSDKYDDVFTCWMCHDAHSYKLNARSELPIEDVIVYDNAICLGCHVGADRLSLLSDKEFDILEDHEWLPNQRLHFQNVRCIECHSELNDSLLVAHKILPKDDAVKKCVECHTTNSLLTASLYKFRLMNKYKPYGFSNPEILEVAYVIGATRNYFLDTISIVVFLIIMVGILIHASLRIFL